MCRLHENKCGKSEQFCVLLPHRNRLELSCSIGKK